jgi:DNA polymerase-3 subunit epsilon
MPPEGRFVDLDKRFLWRDGQAVFNFGEFRGRLLSEVAAQNPAYLDWILSREFPNDTKRIVREAQRGIFPMRES